MIFFRFSINSIKALTYNYHGNVSTVDLSGCSDLDESFVYYCINDVAVVI